MSDVVIVCDNAPVHVNIGTVMEEEEFNGAYLLRLAPYSAPVNPIEDWSVFKSEIKKLNKNSLQDLLSILTPEGTTLTEHRLLYLDNLMTCP